MDVWQTLALLEAGVIVALIIALIGSVIQTRRMIKEFFVEEEKRADAFFDQVKRDLREVGERYKTR